MNVLPTEMLLRYIIIIKRLCGSLTYLKYKNVYVINDMICIFFSRQSCCVYIFPLIVFVIDVCWINERKTWHLFLFSRRARLRDQRENFEAFINKRGR